MWRTCYCKVVAIIVCICCWKSVDNSDAKSRVVKVLKEVPLIDGHNDWPWFLRKHFQDRLQQINLRNYTMEQSFSHLGGHTNIAWLRQGKVGGQFWSAYVRCFTQEKNAIRNVLQQIDLIKRIVKQYKDTFQFATSAKEIKAAHKSGKIASLIGVESGHAIDSSMAVLRMLYELGVRYMTLTHFCNTPWAHSSKITQLDDADTTTKSDGLTAFGKKVVKEMNRLGMLVDLAHVSHRTRLDVLNTSTAPVIFSHSAVYGICNNTANIRDDTLDQIKGNNGVVLVNFLPKLINCNQTFTNTTISSVVNHVNYIRTRIGIDHVGLGSDFDGTRQLPQGLENVSKFPDLLIELAEQGYTDDELKKIAGMNIIRVMEQAEKVAKERQEIETASEALMSVEEFIQDVDSADSCHANLLEEKKAI